MSDLDQWIEHQSQVSADLLMLSVSPTGLVKTRPQFGQTIRPSRGAIVASPVLGNYDPDPDYFFHWFRDSALIVDAMRLLANDPRVRARFADHVGFNTRLSQLDGRVLVANPAWRAGIDPAFARYIRPDADLAEAHGMAVNGETRVNPDGTLDITRWGRPQNDGPALRALAFLRWLQGVRDLPASVIPAIADLVREDIASTLARWRKPCLDIWEEETGHHYYTLRVQAAALEAGADWLAAHDETTPAKTCREQGAAILATLDGYWDRDAGQYRSRMLASGARSTKDLDVAVILAIIHAGGEGPTHSVRDPRMHATLARLDEIFSEDYAINHGRPADRGPALGRYRGDVYMSGGAWYLTTLGAAEFCFRAAEALGASDWRARGDGYLETVRAYTPATGHLSEQFDRTTGEQTSAKHLAWSYAAFLTCAAARRSVRLS